MFDDCSIRVYQFALLVFLQHNQQQNWLQLGTGKDCALPIYPPLATRITAMTS